KVLSGTIPVTPSFVAEKNQIPPHFPIADKEVVYQGEPVDVVLAESKYGAADAANLIDVGYEQLPAVMDLEKALDATSPKVHSGAADRSEEHTSELQSRGHLVCRPLLEKKNIELCTPSAARP